MPVRLFYKLYPNPDSGQYLFILHGLFGMLDNWHNMARELSEYLNVVCVDQRNHGQSPHTGNMSFELMAEDLDHLMETLKVDQAIILGHSMGGKTAMKFADLYPNRVSKLIVVDIAARAYSPGHQNYFDAFNQIDFSQFNTRKKADQALAAIEETPAIRQFLLKNLERKEKGYALKFNLKAIESFYPDMIKALYFQWTITIPALFIYGEHSAYIREEDTLELLEYFPLAKFIKIAGAAHWVHAEQPELFFKAVQRFIQG